MNNKPLSEILESLIAAGAQRGCITFDELNTALPADIYSSEEIEQCMYGLAAAGVEVRDPSDRPSLNER